MKSLNGAVEQVVGLLNTDWSVYSRFQKVLVCKHSCDIYCCSE